MRDHEKTEDQANAQSRANDDASESARGKVMRSLSGLGVDDQVQMLTPQRPLMFPERDTADPVADATSVQPSPIFRANDRDGGSGAGASTEAAFSTATSGTSKEIPHRGEMEQAFGRSFANVQAYTGDRSAAAGLGALGAAAAAHGEKVAFKSSNPDRETVAHELTHVVQQSGGASAAGPQTKLAVSRPGDAYELEAEQVARDVVQGRKVQRVSAIGGTAARQVQRVLDPAVTVPEIVALLGASPPYEGKKIYKKIVGMAAGNRALLTTNDNMWKIAEAMRTSGKSMVRVAIHLGFDLRNVTKWVDKAGQNKAYNSKRYKGLFYGATTAKMTALVGTFEQTLLREKAPTLNPILCAGLKGTAADTVTFLQNAAGLKWAMDSAGGGKALLKSMTPEQRVAVGANAGLVTQLVDAAGAAGDNMLDVALLLGGTAHDWVKWFIKTGQYQHLKDKKFVAKFMTLTNDELIALVTSPELETLRAQNTKLNPLRAMAMAANGPKTVELLGEGLAREWCVQATSGVLGVLTSMTPIQLAAITGDAGARNDLLAHMTKTDDVAVIFEKLGFNPGTAVPIIHGIDPVRLAVPPFTAWFHKAITKADLATLLDSADQAKVEEAGPAYQPLGIKSVGGDREAFADLLGSKERFQTWTVATQTWSKLLVFIGKKANSKMATKLKGGARFDAVLTAIGGQRSGGDRQNATYALNALSKPFKTDADVLKKLFKARYGTELANSAEAKAWREKKKLEGAWTAKQIYKVYWSLKKLQPGPDLPDKPKTVAAALAVDPVDGHQVYAIIKGLEGDKRKEVKNSDANMTKIAKAIGVAGRSMLTVAGWVGGSLEKTVTWMENAGQLAQAGTRTFRKRLEEAKAAEVVALVDGSLAKLRIAAPARSPYPIKSLKADTAKTMEILNKDAGLDWYLETAGGLDAFAKKLTRAQRTTLKTNAALTKVMQHKAALTSDVVTVMKKLGFNPVDAIPKVKEAGEVKLITGSFPGWFHGSTKKSELVTLLGRATDKTTVQSAFPSLQPLSLKILSSSKTMGEMLANADFRAFISACHGWDGALRHIASTMTKTMLKKLVSAGLNDFMAAVGVQFAGGATEAAGLVFDRAAELAPKIDVLYRIFDHRFNIDTEVINNPGNTAALNWASNNNLAHRKWGLKGLRRIYFVFKNMDAGMFANLRKLMCAGINMSPEGLAAWDSANKWVVVAYEEWRVKQKERGGFTKRGDEMRGTRMTDTTTAHELGHQVDAAGLYSSTANFMALANWRKHVTSSEATARAVVDAFSAEMGAANAYKATWSVPKTVGRGNVAWNPTATDTDHLHRVAAKMVNAKQDGYGNFDAYLTAAFTDSGKAVAGVRAGATQHLSQADLRAAIVAKKPKVVQYALEGHANYSQWDSAPLSIFPTRHYHQAYKGEAAWWSFENALMKGNRLSNYQWREPSEYFAELFATYWCSDPLGSRVPGKLRKWFEDNNLHNRA